MKKTSSLIAVALIGISVAVVSASRIRLATARPSQDLSTNKSSMQRQIVAKEREGLDALKTGDLARFGALTADDAVFVDAQGPAGKAQVLKNVVAFRITEYSMDSVEFRAVSPNTGLITYKITEKGISHDKAFAAQVYVSSVWTQRDGKWVCLFSQETAAR